MPLHYIPPTILNGGIVVQLDKEKVEKENKKLRCSLIANVIGELPEHAKVHRYNMGGYS